VRLGGLRMTIILPSTFFGENIMLFYSQKGLYGMERMYYYKTLIIRHNILTACTSKTAHIDVA
jgi:hypothetical protein